jgi:hypothetical protein
VIRICARLGVGLICVLASLPAVAQSSRIPKALPVAELGEPAPEQARRVAVTVHGIFVEGVAFDARRHRLAVVDQAAGPGSKWPDSARAGAGTGGLAAINGGFFTPQGEPLGLVVSQGKASGRWNGATSLGSGLWFEDGNGRMVIARRELLGRAGAKATRELIQAGPLLIDRRRVVGGLDDLNVSARSILLSDGKSRWLMARTAPCSLAGLARALATAAPAGWAPRMALNLDGGRSAELWISDRIPGGPTFTRPLWNKPVRNFLVLHPRS